MVRIWLFVWLVFLCCRKSQIKWNVDLQMTWTLTAWNMLCFSQLARQRKWQMMWVRDSSGSFEFSSWKQYVSYCLKKRKKWEKENEGQHGNTVCAYCVFATHLVTADDNCCVIGFWLVCKQCFHTFVQKCAFVFAFPNIWLPRSSDRIVSLLCQWVCVHLQYVSSLPSLSHSPSESDVVAMHPVASAYGKQRAVFSLFPTVAHTREIAEDLLMMIQDHIKTISPSPKCIFPFFFFYSQWLKMN